MLRVEHQGRVHGTAFLVGLADGEVAALTCRHVIEAAGFSANGDAEVTLVALQDGETRTARVDWGAVAEGVDLVLLRLDADPALTPQDVALDDDCQGHEFMSVGFHHDADDRREYWGPGRVVLPVGEGLGRELQLTDCNDVTRGFSGAPVYDLAARRVVAVMRSIQLVDEHERGLHTAYGIAASAMRMAIPSLARRRARPFRGLGHFTEADGRYWVDPTDGLSERLVSRLLAASGVALLVGPSGVGKSSLVHAGLLPRLREDARRHDARALAVRLDAAGALALSRACGEAGDAAASRLVEVLDALSEKVGAQRADADRPLRYLVIDQFEEVLLLEAPHPDLDPRPPAHSVAQALLALAAGTTSVRLLVVLREQYLGRFGEVAPRLKERLFSSREDVPQALSEACLARIITEPAIAAEHPWDGAFAGQLVEAVQQRYAAEDGSAVGVTVLPILETFLEQSWDRHEAGVHQPATRAAMIEQLGQAMAQQVSVAVEDAKRRLPVDAPSSSSAASLEELVTGILLPLVTFEVGAKSEQPKGRAMAASALQAAVSADQAAFDAVLRALIEHRVLSARGGAHGGGGEDYLVEVVHDAVFSGWAPLSGLLDRERELAAWKASIEPRAARVAKAERDGKSAPTVDLLSGRDLRYANLISRGRTLDEDLERLIRRSREREKERRARIGVGVLAVAAMILVTLIGAVASRVDAHLERLQHERAAIAAETRRLRDLRASRREMAEAQVRSLGQESEALVNALLATSPLSSDEQDPRAGAALSAALNAFDMRAPFDLMAEDEPTQVAITDDGRRVVFRLPRATAGDVDEAYLLFDVETGAQLAELSSERFCLPSGEEPNERFGTCETMEREMAAFAELLLPPRSLLTPDPPALWRSNGPAGGVTYVPLDAPSQRAVRFADLRVISLDRSSAGDTVAVAAEDGTIGVWRGDRELTRIQQPGGGWAVAVEGEAPVVLTHGPGADCYYPRPGAPCQSIDVPDEAPFGDVDLGPEGRCGTLSTFNFAIFGDEVASVNLVMDGRSLRVGSGLVADLEITGGGSLPPIPGVRESRTYIVAEGWADQRYRLESPCPLPDSSDGVNISSHALRFDRGAFDVTEQSRVGGMSARVREEGAAGCGSGQFRQSVRCGDVEVSRQGGQWLRVRLQRPPVEASPRNAPRSDDAGAEARAWALVAEAGVARVLRRDSEVGRFPIRGQGFELGLVPLRDGRALIWNGEDGRLRDETGRIVPVATSTCAVEDPNAPPPSPPAALPSRPEPPPAPPPPPPMEDPFEDAYPTPPLGSAVPPFVVSPDERWLLWTASSTAGHVACVMPFVNGATPSVGDSALVLRGSGTPRWVAVDGPATFVRGGVIGPEVWEERRGRWERRHTLGDLRGMTPLEVSLSPSGARVAVVSDVQESLGPADAAKPYPSTFVAVFDTDRWTLQRVVPSPGGQSVAFIDDDHLVVAGHEVDLSLAAMRERACGLLRHRSEYVRVREVCEPPKRVSAP